MISQQQAHDLEGRDVHGEDRQKIGTAGALHLDGDGAPQFVVVHHGMLSTKESLVPLADATLDEGGLTVPFTKKRVTGAPRVGADGHLDEDGERALLEHYGLAPVGTTTTRPPRSEATPTHREPADGASRDEVTQAQVDTDQTEIVQDPPPRP